MSLNPQLFLIPSFCLRPLLLPWDCVDSLHLRDDAREPLCTTSKQAVTASRQRRHQTSQPGTPRLRVAKTGQAPGTPSFHLQCHRVCSLLSSWYSRRTALPSLSTCAPSLGPHVHLRGPPEPRLLAGLTRSRGKNGNKKSSSDFSSAECPTHLELPPLIYLLKKENLPVEAGRVIPITHALPAPFRSDSTLLPDTSKSMRNGSPAS